MAEVKRLPIYEFTGMKQAGSDEPYSTRNSLASVQDATDMHLNSRGQYWMPPTLSTFFNFASATGEIHSILPIWWPDSGGARWWLVQFATKLHLINAVTGAEVTDGGWPYTLPTNNWTGRKASAILSYVPDLVNYDYGWYVGNNGWTVRVERNTTMSGTPIITNVSSSVQNGGVQASYHNRRWVGFDTSAGYSQLWYSDINSQTFGATSWIHIPDYQDVDSYIRALIPYQDYLIIFTGSHMWRLRGTTIDDFEIERLDLSIGATSTQACVVWNNVLYFISYSEGKEGVYAYNGAEAKCLSTDIGDIFRAKRPAWDQSDEGTWPWEQATLTVWDEHLIVSNPGLGSSPRMYVTRLDTAPNWTTIGGWPGSPSVGPVITTGRGAAARFYIGTDYTGPMAMVGFGDTIYYSTDPLFRYSNTASIKFGYEDFQGTPHDLKRLLSLKLIIWKAGTGTPTFDLTVTSAAGETRSFTSQAILGTSWTDGTIVLPLEMRTSGLQVDLTVTESNQDSQVVLEGMELLYSEKGVKAGAVG